MDREKQVETAIKLLSEGKRVAEVAKLLGVSQKTVYAWRSANRQEFIHELEALKYIDVFASKLEEIEQGKLLSWFVANQITKSRMLYDEETDKVTTSKGSLRDCAEFMRLYRDFLKMEIDLFVTVGVIPRRPEHLPGSISDARQMMDSDEFSSIDREELKNRALKSLAELKDQFIL